VVAALEGWFGTKVAPLSKALMWWAVRATPASFSSEEDALE